MDKQNQQYHHHNHFYNQDKESTVLLKNMKIHHKPSRFGAVKRKLLISKVSIIKRRGEFLSPAIISLVLISYILADDSIMTIMSAGRSFNNNNLKMASQYQRSMLIKTASAEPVPQPSPASARTSSSASHRLPPINGSIFGKRSLDSLANKSSSSPSLSPSANKRPNSSKANSQQPNESDQQMPSKFDAKNSISETASYNDIITEIIEDFLALNSESDPEEASVAFCRMIVYECSKMLSARSEALARRRKLMQLNKVKVI